MVSNILTHPLLEHPNHLHHFLLTILSPTFNDPPAPTLSSQPLGTHTPLAPTNMHTQQQAQKKEKWRWRSRGKWRLRPTKRLSKRVHLLSPKIALWTSQMPKQQYWGILGWKQSWAWSKTKNLLEWGVCHACANTDTSNLYSHLKKHHQIEHQGVRTKHGGKGKDLIKYSQGMHHLRSHLTD